MPLDFKATDRCELTLDEQYRPHSFDGQPSVKYPDGRTEYHIRGVRVPDFVITQPERIKVSDIQKETNTEVRRVMLEKYGLSRYLKNANARLIGEDSYGKLWRVPVPNDEDLVMVEVLNSSLESDWTRKTYFLRVPPSMRSTREALAWTFGMINSKEYSPDLET